MCAKRAVAANYARRVANGLKPANSMMDKKFANVVKKYTVAAGVFLRKASMQGLLTSAKTRSAANAKGISQQDVHKNRSKDKPNAKIVK